MQKKVNAEYRRQFAYIMINRIEEILSSGCNERLIPVKENYLKYGLDVMDLNVENRGSCTCSNLTQDSLESATKAIEEYDNADSFTALIEQRSDRIKRLFNTKDHDRFEVIYAPSGTDLSYFPNIGTRVLFPGWKIVNILTCADEVGSSSGVAAAAKYHGTLNQFGEGVPKGERINANESIEVLNIRIRNDKGEIQDTSKNLGDLIGKYHDHAIIVHLAITSKSGIELSLDVIDKFNARNIIWVVDLCQFRHNLEYVKKLIAKDVMVMITGSKFYQSPPFCGAMLVPYHIYRKLRITNWSNVKDYASTFSKYDMPVSLHDRVPFPDHFNLSTHVRWACALDEIERYHSIDQSVRENKVDEWHAAMVDYVSSHDNFELMQGQEVTNTTILPFRVKVNGRYLNYAELKQFHFDFVTHKYDIFEHGSVFIGQPVAFGENGFLRLAIGAQNIRKFIDDDEKEFTIDKKIMDLLSREAYNTFG